MRISDWSSDVCSSDLPARHRLGTAAPVADRRIDVRSKTALAEVLAVEILEHALPFGGRQFGRQAGDPVQEIPSDSLIRSVEFAIGPAGLHDLGERGAGGGEEIETPVDPDEGLPDFGGNPLPPMSEA